MTETAALSETARNLRGKIRRASLAAEKGDVVDLVPLKAEVDSLCKGIAALPKNESKSLQSDIIGMIEELSHLSERLNQGLDIIKQELQSLAERQRAVSAYGKAP